MATGDNSMDEHYSFTDLSERLQGPDGQAVAELCRERLAQLQQLVAKRIADGVIYQEYEKYRQLAESLAAAQRLVVRICSSSSQRASVL
jgi:hypothetical protein